MFKPLASILPTEQQVSTPTPVDNSLVNNVFKVFHGFYGNLFLMKFATGQIAGPGEVDNYGQPIEGQDKGVISAKQIWAHGLKSFDANTVKTSLSQVMVAHPEYPPSLPQLVAVCAANKPREVYKPAIPQISMGQPLRSKYAAQAREINARHAQRGFEKRMDAVVTGTGLEPLKQAIASAIGAAGGDEVLELMRLDSMFQPKATNCHA